MSLYLVTNESQKVTGLENAPSELLLHLEALDFKVILDVGVDGDNRVCDRPSTGDKRPLH